MRVDWGRRVRSLLAGAGIALCVSWAVGAQEPEKKREPARTPEERVEGEGLFRLRENYFARRRQKPGDPSFDAAKARLDAVRSIQSRMTEESLGSGAVSPAAWSNIGPAPINLGQTPTSLPRFPSDVSGRAVAIAIDPVDNSVYIGGAQGGVWKSTDNGGTWTPLTDGLTSLAIGSIAIDPAAHTAGNATIYVGTGEGNSSCDSYGGVGIYKSTNSGATWAGPFGNAQFLNRGVVSIAVDRTSSSHLLAASASGFFSPACIIGPGVLPSRGIYESSDGGGTWTQRTTGNNRASVVLQDPLTATTWWGALWFTGNGGQDGGLVKSIDNGSTWNQVAGTGGLPAAGSAWGRAYISGTVDNPLSPSNSVFYLGNSMSSGTLYKSVDSGANWSALSAANGYCDGQCVYDMPVYVEPGDQNKVYVGGAGQSGALPTLFMRSDNGGSTFGDKVRSPSTNTALHADMHFITSWPGQPNRIWVANDGGVWRSDDRGDTWVNVNAGLAITQFSGCDLHPTDPLSAYAGSQDNGTEGWQGLTNWKHLDFGDGGFALVDQGNPDNLVHTYFNQTNNLIGVGFTTGGFATTMGNYNVSLAGAAPNGTNNGIALTDRVEFYAPIHLDRGVSNTLYFGTNRLWRANNFFVTGGTGGEFVAVNAGQDLAPSGALSAIETFANPAIGFNADLIYTGSDNGHVFRTTNANAVTPTWTEVDIGGSALWVADILVDPSNSQIVYQARAGYAAAPGLNVRKSTNGGASWGASGTGLPNVPVNALALDPVTANRIWAGTDVGIYVSSDAGANWAPYANRLPPVSIFDLKANAATKQLLACTHGRSAYMLSLDDDLIFKDGLESHGFANWSSVQSDGDLTITPAAAMGGSTVGLQAVVNDTNPLFVQDNLPNNEPRYRARLYVNPNSFDPGEASGHFRVRVLIGFNAVSERLVTLVMRRLGGQYSIEGRVRRNDGTRADTGFINITNAAHFIEFDWVKASPGQTNGTFTLYIDGVAQTTLTGIANDGSGIDFARLGALSIKTGAAGTIFLDQFVSRRVNYNGPES